MKIRYTKQLNKTDCVPTAFANLMKWSGQNFSYKNNKCYLRKIFKYVPGYGTETHNIEKVMKKSLKKLKVNKKYKISYEEAIEHLNKNGCIFFLYQPIAGYNHAALVIKENKKTISIVNHHPKYHNSIVFLNKKYFKKCIKRYHQAYLVKKINN